MAPGASDGGFHPSTPQELLVRTRQRGKQIRLVRQAVTAGVGVLIAGLIVGAVLVALSHTPAHGTSAGHSRAAATTPARGPSSASAGTTPAGSSTSSGGPSTSTTAQHPTGPPSRSITTPTGVPGAGTTTTSAASTTTPPSTPPGAPSSAPSSTPSSTAPSTTTGRSTSTTAAPPTSGTSSTTRPVSTTGPTTTTTTTPPASVCQADQLLLGPESWQLTGLLTGQLTFTLTNISGTACQTTGYPYAAVLNVDGVVQQHPATDNPDLGYGPQPVPARTVKLGPGATVQFVLQSSLGGPGCLLPYLGSTLDIVPPGQSGSLELRSLIPFLFCDLEVGPIQPAEG